MKLVKYASDFVRTRYGSDRIEAVVDLGFFAGIGLLIVGQVTSPTVTYAGVGTLSADGAVAAGKYFIQR